MVNELEMPSEDVAIALGHQDGGNLVRRLYGHRDKGRALDRIIDAYADVVDKRPSSRPAKGTDQRSPDTHFAQPTLFDLPHTAPDTAHDHGNHQ